METKDLSNGKKLGLFSQRSEGVDEVFDQNNLKTLQPTQRNDNDTMKQSSIRITDLPKSNPNYSNSFVKRIH